MEEKVLDYIKYVLEVPRDEYNGMPTCPFAKQERESNNIYIDTLSNNNDFIICMHSFVKSGVNSAVFIQNDELGELETKRYQKFLNNTLKTLDLSNWKALCINPNDNLEVDGFNARSLAPCFMILINNKKDIYYAHKSMQNTKYYDKMDPKYKRYLGIK